MKIKKEPANIMKEVRKRDSRIRDNAFVKHDGISHSL